jgi:cystathionine beta-lyase family protein involved in aluminum resistance
MTTSTLVLVDAGMVAGFRRATISLAQLHQALVHLYRQHPDVKVAVVADPAVKWDLAGQEPAAFEGDIIAGAVVCAPAGALEGTAGFLERAAARATAAGYQVVAFTARALPGVALGQLRNEAGRWDWDLDGTRTLDAADVKAAASASPDRRRRRSR